MSNSVEQENMQQTGTSHDAPLFAEPVTHLGSFPITNSLLMSWLAFFVIALTCAILAKKIKEIPRGIQNFFELLLENALGLADSVTGDRQKTEKFFPIVVTLFFFILVNNWLGLLPGIGTVGFYESHEGASVFVPFLRGGTADLNTTLAISLFVVVFSHIIGVISVGAWTHFNKFFNFKALIGIPSHFKKDRMVVVVAPIKVFVGIIEAIGEIAKVASLSLRLFGNIFAGEVLLASMMAIFAFILPLPFMLLEIIVGIVQALVFSVLALAFISIATTAEEH